MSVKELIEILSSIQDKDKEVYIQNGDNGGDYLGWRAASSVEEGEDEIIIV